MESPRVSVVLPTYRRPAYLERAITSVMTQTVSSWELIIVDDNDPEAPERRQTEALVAARASDPRIHYVRHPRNLGGAAARNTGIGAAKAPYVAFLDDDDTWHETKLERQLARIELAPNDVALVYCRVRVVMTETGHTGLFRTDGRSPTIADLLSRNPIGTTSCVLCRTDAVRRVGGFDASLPARQDLDLYVRLARHYAFAFVDAPLVTLYKHDQPRISTDVEAAIRAHELFAGKHKALIDSNPAQVFAERRRLGRLLVAAERYRQARPVLLQAIRAKPTDIEALLRFAMTFAPLRVLVSPTKRLLGLLRGKGRSGLNPLEQDL